MSKEIMAGRISIAVECNAAEVAAALERLTIAANAANDALTKLGAADHGGVHISMVGEVMSCEVLPVTKAAE